MRFTAIVLWQSSILLVALSVALSVAIFCDFLGQAPLVSESCSATLTQTPFPTALRNRSIQNSAMDISFRRITRLITSTVIV